jgi:ribonuclease Y
MDKWLFLGVIAVLCVTLIFVGIRLVARTSLRGPGHRDETPAPLRYGRAEGPDSVPHSTTGLADAPTISHAAMLSPSASALQAEADAEAIRMRAERDAESIRRSVATETEAMRRAAASITASADAAATETLRRAELRAADITEQAERRALRETDERLGAIEAAEHSLEARRLAADRRESELEGAVGQLQTQQAEHASARLLLEDGSRSLERERAEFEAQRLTDLQRVAELSVADAKAELMAAVEATARRDAAMLARDIEAEARAGATDRARAIVVEAVQRVSSEQTAESVVSVLHLPSDEMKGRIIGREGRNIRAFESVTGVNVIIDDTPEAVLLSCFDPVRREIGRVTLTRLVADGRIHPHRIEEVYDLARAEVDELCLRAAHDALAEVGITDLDDGLVPTLGRLKYRTSYGQNVLGHLLETAHIAGVMAHELGIEASVVRRAAFLHDIGKALTHEVEGSHAIIGAELLRTHGESEAVVHAVEAHHNEVAPRTVEAVLTQAADACSAGRPGARRESLETYVKRLRRIEQIASAKEGVEKVFAMQSGREVRVMVLPNVVDDLAAGVIAREVAKQIEDELTYPGQIRVTVVRESRATEVAH